MRLKHVFVYISFACAFGMCIFILTSRNFFHISDRTCYSMYIEVGSTERLGTVLMLRNQSKWIDDFQEVSGENTQIYSAFVEEKTKIRILGITNDTGGNFYCILWYNTSPVTTRLVKAYIANINENHGKRVTAAYFLCYLCGLDVPDAVSLTTYSSLTSPKNILPVHVIHERKNKIFFTMCLSPIHSSFKNSAQIYEWIELNKILGVDKFIIYLNSASREVNDVLEFYNQLDEMIDVLPWSLSSKLCDDKQLHYCGQLAALNDCLYRSKGVTHYIAATDLDEFIVPQFKTDSTWMDMLLRIPDHSVYLFGNVFYLSDEDASMRDSQVEPLMISNLMQDNYVFGPHARSKLIAFTDDLVTFGIHNAWALHKDTEHYVDPAIGLLHHYRKGPFQYPAGVTVQKHKNNVTIKYLNELNMNIAYIRQKLEKFRKFDNK